MRTSSRLREGPDRRTLKGAAIARSCLIVEDELLIGVDLEDTIQSAGFEVRWVASLKRALAAVDQNPPDVAVIDVALHDGSSTELARELMRREIPFVVHSGSGRGCAVGLARDHMVVQAVRAVRRSRRHQQGPARCD